MYIVIHFIVLNNSNYCTSYAVEGIPTHNFSCLFKCIIPMCVTVYIINTVCRAILCTGCGFGSSSRLIVSLDFSLISPFSPYFSCPPPWDLMTSPNPAKEVAHSLKKEANFR